MTCTAKTARNHIPAIFRKVRDNFYFGQVNLDLGGGPFEKMTDALAEEGVINLVYDPENRSPDHNHRIMNILYKRRAQTCTLSNVLNVIQTVAQRKVILEMAKQYTMERVYITVYEGDRSGEARQTRDGWQNNRKLKLYLDEVQEIFPDSWIEKGVIVCNCHKQKARKKV